MWIVRRIFGTNQERARQAWRFVMADTFRSICICVAAAAVHGWLAFALLRLLLLAVLACVVRIAAAMAGDVWEALDGGAFVLWVLFAFVAWCAVDELPPYIIPVSLLGALSPSWSSVLLPLIHCGFCHYFGPNPLPAVVLYFLGLLLRLLNWWLAVPAAALAFGLLIRVMCVIYPPPPPPPVRYKSFQTLGTAPLPQGCCGAVREVLLASDYYEVCCSIRGLELLELLD